MEEGLENLPNTSREEDVIHHSSTSKDSEESLYSPKLRKRGSKSPPNCDDGFNDSVLGLSSEHILSTHGLLSFDSSSNTSPSLIIAGDSALATSVRDSLCQAQNLENPFIDEGASEDAFELCKNLSAPDESSRIEILYAKHQLVSRLCEQSMPHLIRIGKPT